ncbi:MAG: hypothetical protein J5J06_15130 [Phycisphaerae bacterium]|nr:hypothetical protein [Phycisphaerae bacterium]
MSMTSSIAGHVGPAARGRAALHVAAVVLAVLVFPLLFVGAGVTSKGAGMAYPDWPTSGGHLLNPPGWWVVEATRWEHGHRLIGWTVGMTAIIVAALGHRMGGVLRVLGWTTLGAIIIQGILGGMRVWEVSTLLAMIHGVFGQACFCLAACTALVSSRAWSEERDGQRADAAGFLRGLSTLAAVATFIQLLTGALLRHFLNNAALVVHLFWALVVMILVGWVGIWLAGSFSRASALGKAGRALGVLLAIQVVLGVATFIVIFGGVTDWPLLAWLLPTAHTAVGALLLMTTVVTRAAVGRMIAFDPTPGRVTLSESPA